MGYLPSGEKTPSQLVEEMDGVRCPSPRACCDPMVVDTIMPEVSVVVVGTTGMGGTGPEETPQTEPSRRMIGGTTSRFGSPARPAEHLRGERARV